MGIKINSNEYPLTYKWRGKIRSLAYNFKISFEDAVQESLILEWELKNKSLPEQHLENYFRKVIYQRVSSYRSGKWEEGKVQIEAKDVEEDVSIDKLIVFRDFDTMFYEEMVYQISQMLTEVDVIASEIFLYRVRENLRWVVIKSMYYPKVPHNYFYHIIKLIKQVVFTEIQLCRI